MQRADPWFCVPSTAQLEVLVTFLGKEDLSTREYHYLRSGGQLPEVKQYFSVCRRCLKPELPCSNCPGQQRKSRRKRGIAIGPKFTMVTYGT